MSSILRIQEFLTALDSIAFSNIDSYRKDVNCLCKKELDYLRANIDLSTLRRYRTDYRNAIRKYYDGKEIHVVYHDKKNKGKPTHIAVKYFALKRSEVKQYVDYENKRKSVYQNAFEDHKLVIINYPEMITTAISLLDSNSAYDITAGLLLLTGRRTVEVWKLARFELVKSNIVNFYGQAKTRDSANAKEFYPIFTLCNSLLVCNALDKLRSIKDFSNSTERVVNASTSTRLSRVVKQHFNSFIKDYDGLIEAKDLRAIYVHIAQRICAPHLDLQAFAKQQLGHILSNTADNYMLFRLAYPNEK
jgi:hypothetical protein